MRKIHLIWLALLILLSFLSSSLASGSESGKSALSEGYTYTILEDGSACITKCRNGGELAVPNELDGHAVTRIADRAFDRNGAVTSVTIPEGVTHLGSGAFYWCDKLEEVKLPRSLESMGTNPFEMCTSLKTIQVPKDHTVFEVKNGVLFHKAEKTLICYPFTKKGGNYSVPEGTLHIGDRAFSQNENIRSISFPKSLLTIGTDAFHSCFQLAGALKLPQQLHSLGTGAFAMCGGISSLSIPSSLTEIGEKAFMGCEVKKITISDKNPAYKLIDDVLFTEDGKTLVYYPCRRPGERYDVPVGTEKLMSGSFYWVQDLTVLSICEGVTDIGDFVVYVCYNLSDVRLPASLEKIGDHSLEGQNSDFHIMSPAGSYADEWCRKQRMSGPWTTWWIPGKS